MPAPDCGEPVHGCAAVSCIAAGGFTIDGAGELPPSRQEIPGWGYVDQGNLYGDAGSRRILQEWWAGDGPDTGTWRFNLTVQPQGRGPRPGWPVI